MEVRFFSLAKCSSRANFDRSHDGPATIFNFGPFGAKKGHEGPKRALWRPKCVFFYEIEKDVQMNSCTGLMW